MARSRRRKVSAVLGVVGGLRLRALAAAILLVAVIALPAVAATGGISLLSPSASPTTGTTTTDITLSVDYHSQERTAPAYVRVDVAGSTHAMAATSTSTQWRKGVTFAVTLRLPAGTWPTRFEAADVNGTIAATDGPTVTIQGPPPTPAPTPKPTPAPTPAPTPKPTAAPTAKPTPGPTAAPTAKPTPRPTAAAVAKPTHVPTASPASAAASSPASPTDSPSPSPSTGPIAVVVPPLGGSGAGPSGPSVDTPAGGSSGQGGPAASLGSAGGPAALMVRLLPTMVVTTGAVAMTMAFLAFGRRRRDELPTAPDAVLASQAASGWPSAAGSGLVPAPAAVADPVSVATALRAAAIAPAVAGPVDADMPRWRRPSLMEARKADPLRTVSTSVSLTFTGRASEAVSGLERRRIRYRLVSLLDQPDDVRGVEIGSLDEGDEVVLLERHGTYWRVLCPDGREGWLHKMVLGAAIEEVPAPQPQARAVGSWTSADEGPAPGSFEDVLRLYSENRRQYGEA